MVAHAWLSPTGQLELWFALLTLTAAAVHRPLDIQMFLFANIYTKLTLAILPGSRCNSVFRFAFTAAHYSQNTRTIRERADD